MSNGVRYYENLFDKIAADPDSLLADMDKYDYKNVLQKVYYSKLATEGVDVDPKLFAALALLSQYARCATSSHVKEAGAIISGIVLVAGTLWQRNKSYNESSTAKDLILLAIFKFLGIKLQDKPTSESLEHFTEAFKEQLVTPSPIVNKNILNVSVESAIKIIDAKPRSGFASLVYVLIKKLDLNIENEQKKKIIEGANFSEGFLHCGSSTNRKALELANLRNIEPAEEKQALSARI